jgi:hypothetical protein
MNKKRYYVVTIQQPYGYDTFIWGSPWPPSIDPSNGERLIGPYDTYEDAACKVSEIEAGNKCLQGEWYKGRWTRCSTS